MICLLLNEKKKGGRRREQKPGKSLRGDYVKSDLKLIEKNGMTPIEFSCLWVTHTAADSPLCLRVTKQYAYRNIPVYQESELSGCQGQAHHQGTKSLE